MEGLNLKDSELSLYDWFSCPMCGEGKEVIAWFVGSAGGIEFKCKSRSHRLESAFYRRFNRETKVSENEGKKRFNSLKSCVSCPYCGSDRADGGVEHKRIKFNYQYYLVFTCTVWCLSCEKFDRTSLCSENHYGIKSKLIKEAEDRTQFPPEYIS